MADNFFSRLFKGGGKKDAPEGAPGDVAGETPPATDVGDTAEIASDDAGAARTEEEAAPPSADDVLEVLPEDTRAEAEPHEPAPAAEPVADPYAPDPGAPNASQAQANVEAAPVAAAPDEIQEEAKAGWFSRLRRGLSRSSSKLSDGVTSIFTKRKLDDDAIEELQDLLISADLGVNIAAQVTTELAKDRFDKDVSDEEVRSALAAIVAGALAPLQQPLEVDLAKRPHVILMTGVNGAGKTTTIGKLAAKFMAEGKSVMLAAGDTFRAAAIEQLAAWGGRVGAPVIARDVGADAAGLAFDALKEAQAAGTDVLLIDTAGRLQNRKELMDELAKIVRVLKKLDMDAPHSTLLVLDATVGQNALSQAAAFKEIADVSGVVMTKLDGTARGGVLVALADKHPLPIHFVGVGEGVDDLQPFDAAAFADALAGADRAPRAA